MIRTLPRELLARPTAASGTGRIARLDPAPDARGTRPSRRASSSPAWPEPPRRRRSAHRRHRLPRCCACSPTVAYRLMAYLAERLLRFATLMSIGSCWRRSTLAPCCCGRRTSPAPWPRCSWPAGSTSSRLRHRPARRSGREDTASVQLDLRPGGDAPGRDAVAARSSSPSPSVRSPARCRSAPSSTGRPGWPRRSPSWRAPARRRQRCSSPPGTVLVTVLYRRAFLASRSTEARRVLLRFAPLRPAGQFPDRPGVPGQLLGPDLRHGGERRHVDLLLGLLPALPHRCRATTSQMPLRSAR